MNSNTSSLDSDSSNSTLLSPRLVYLNHDGGVDDLVSLFLLLNSPDVKLIGVGIIEGDCFIEPALSASLKLIHRFSTYPVSVSLSKARAKNSFPLEWRKHAYYVDFLPLLNQHYPHQDPPRPSNLPAHEHLVSFLLSAPQKVTLIFTGPLTDLALALSFEPKIRDKIESIYWMGGAFWVEGNVDFPNSEGACEWNAFWDPEAVDAVVRAKLPLKIVSLDSTNTTPLTQSLLFQWAQNRERVGFDLLAQMYSFLEPVFLLPKKSTYFFWDVLTTLIALKPSIAKTKRVNIEVITSGRRSGETKEKAGGEEAEVVTAVDSEGFYSLFWELASRSKAF